MKTTHTAGPWMINGGIIEAAPVGRPFQHLQQVCIVGVPNNQTPEDTANARLIASAPALLDACKQAVCGNMGWQGKAKDAIAKAEA